MRSRFLTDAIAAVASAALLRGVYGFDGYRVMGESAALAVELETDPASPWYALARAALGFSRDLHGEPGAAEGPLEQAVSSEAAVPQVRMLGLSLLALTAIDLGKLARAEERPRRPSASVRAEIPRRRRPVPSPTWRPGRCTRRRDSSRKPAPSLSKPSSSASGYPGSARGSRFRSW